MGGLRRKNVKLDFLTKEEKEKLAFSTLQARIIEQMRLSATQFQGETPLSQLEPRAHGILEAALSFSRTKIVAYELGRMELSGHPLLRDDFSRDSIKLIEHFAEKVTGAPVTLILSLGGS